MLEPTRLPLLGTPGKPHSEAAKRGKKQSSERERDPGCNFAPFDSLPLFF